MNIYEIAQQAGVSPSVVSKALNGRKGVSDRMRKKVLDVAQKNDFSPKTAINFQKNVAFVFRSNESSSNIFCSNFMISLLSGVCDYAFDHQYNVLMFPSIAIPKNQSEFFIFCRQQQLTGCVFGNLQKNDRYVEDIAGVVPLVAINSNFHGDKLYSVSSNDYHGMRSAIEYLYKMGHRNIGIALAGLWYQSNNDKFRAYQDALQEWSLPQHDEYLFQLSQFSQQDFCRSWQNIKDMGKPFPTAILTMHDDDAVKIINALRSINLSCPEDVSVMGYDDYAYVTNLTPALTTVKQVLFEKGRVAARLACGCALEELEMPVSPNGAIVFDTRLSIRDSVRQL